MKINKTESGEVARLSIVSEPANGSYICSEQVCNISGNIITAVVLEAGAPVYRSPKGDVDEHFVIFTQEVVESTAHQFLARNMNNNLSTDHSAFLSDNIKMVESFVNGGIWRVRLMIEDVELLNKIKAGEYNGISIEGVFVLTTLLDISDDIDKFEADVQALSLEDKELIFGQYK